ncbi:MAG: hypothetical protein FWC61_04865 [Proteobacteria bacterium]|nr:hypothetical protein [Pseudomonadota bacterium]
MLTKNPALPDFYFPLFCEKYTIAANLFFAQGGFLAPQGFFAPKLFGTGFAAAFLVKNGFLGGAISSLLFLQF